MLVSLDHTLWFHSAFNAADWHLYVMESPIAAASRALCHGHLYSRDGTLVLSIVRCMHSARQAHRPARPRRSSSAPACRHALCACVHCGAALEISCFRAITWPTISRRICGGCGSRWR